MTATGSVKNGMVILDPGVQFPEGARVRIEAVSESTPKESALTNQLLDWAGKGQDLPEDLAKNHDHYVHGLAKR